MSELKSEPIGANGMLYVMKRVGKIFSEGSLGNKSGGSEGVEELPPSQPEDLSVPVVASESHEQCVSREVGQDGARETTKPRQDNRAGDNSRGAQNSPVYDTKWPIGTTDIIKEQCRICSGKGFVCGGIGKERECTHCEQRGYYEYRFPREIVKLANKLAHQDALTIARTLAGLKLGMTP